MASKVFVSPGVYTTETELSFVSQSVGVTTLGLVGETLKGPAFEPIFITNYDEFQSYFGGTSPEKFVNTQIPKYEAAYIAKSYLQQSNQLFVTRVLGLSGYDAGPSWTITTIGNTDCETINFNNNIETYADFNSTIGTSTPFGWSTNTNKITSVPPRAQWLALDPVVADFYDKLYDTVTLFDGTETTNFNILQEWLQTNIFPYNGVSGAEQNALNNNVLFFGAVDRNTQSSVGKWSNDGTKIGQMTGQTNAYGIDSTTFSEIDTCDSNNDTWFYNLFGRVNETGDTYSGYSFVIGCASLTSAQFFLKVGYVSYTANTVTAYNNLPIATFRSRGISEFTTTQHGTNFQVSGLTDLGLDFSGSYSAATYEPYSTFKVTGLTYDNTSFSFETSFSEGSTNYLKKVFGVSNFDKDRDVVPAFIEEGYQKLLDYGYKKGFIRGLNSTLTSLPKAQTASSTSIANYLEKYQTPVTPYFVSELRGTKVYNLFRFISISDGSAANTEIKVSIGNMSFANNNFDVFVRSYYDTDSNPVVLEKFTNCSMNPDDNNYIAKRIGTSDGEFQVLSRYIMVEVNPEAPIDALPCGFNGYVVRDYNSVADQNKHPFPVIKTKYDYPGEVLFNPPYGLSSGVDNTLVSKGDNVRRTYLGFSTNPLYGYDDDFVQYKGKQIPASGGFSSCGISDGSFSGWTWVSKGFHMDSGATVVKISSAYQNAGDDAFDVGTAQFRTDPDTQTNPYYRLYARKFTALFYGGFDGWDVYRERRTNADEFIMGNSGYLAGAASCPPYSNATGWGFFRTTVVDGNETDYATTDYYAYLIGVQTFNNPSTTNINVFATPGIDYVNNYELVNNTISMIEYDRADSIYITTTPDFELLQPSTSMDNLIYPQDAVNNLETQDIDSNYTATYYPWVLTRDTVNNNQLYIPATAEVCRNLALTDNIAFPWFATAGYTRGVVNAVRARRRLTQEERDVLYKGRINPIATFNDVGTVIWGNKTLQIKESPLDRINVRRLLLQARKLISAVAIRLLFEQNDNIVRQQFLDSVNPILDAIRRDRGLYDFRVTVQNTPEDLDANQLVGKIYIKPTKALEFIDIEFLITPTGASFENV